MPRVALVTGGSGALGQAITHRFLADGAAVCVPWIVERERERLEASVDAAARARLMLERCDVGDDAAMVAVVERALKRHPAGLLRLRVPSLLVLDRLTITTVAVSLAALTAGIIPGIVRLPEHGLDVLIAGTLVLWALGASVLYLRVRAGRRELAAVLALGGVGAVIVLQLGLLFAHVA